MVSLPLIHVFVDHIENIDVVALGRISQIDHGHIVTVVFLRNPAIVPRQIALGVGAKKAHSAGTGIFQIGIQKEGGFADAGRTDHHAMNVIAVHQRKDVFPMADAAQYKPLIFRLPVSSAPVTRRKPDLMVHSLYFFRFCEPRRTMLTVPHRFSFDAVQSTGSSSFGYEGEYQQRTPANQYHPIFRLHCYFLRS